MVRPTAAPTLPMPAMGVVSVTHEALVLAAVLAAIPWSDATVGTSVDLVLKHTRALRCDRKGTLRGREVLAARSKPRRTLEVLHRRQDLDRHIAPSGRAGGRRHRARRLLWAHDA